MGYSNNIYKLKRFIPNEGAFYDLNYDEVYAVIDWLKIELTERTYPNSRYPEHPIKKLAVRQPIHITKLVETSEDSYRISWNNTSYEILKHYPIFDIIEKSNRLSIKFDEYFDFNHENRGKKLKKFGI